MRGWRALAGPVQDVIFQQEHEPGRLGLSDFTDTSALGITIAGVAHENRSIESSHSHLKMALEDALLLLGSREPAVVEPLSTCRRAMTANSKMLIFEVIVDPDSLFPKLLDLMMMVWTGGLEHTIMQYEQLLASAGLRLIRVIPTRTAIWILEAVP